MDETIMTPIVKTLVLCEMTEKMDAGWRPPDRVLRGLRLSVEGLNRHTEKLQSSLAEIPHTERGFMAQNVVQDRIHELNKVAGRIEKVLEKWN